ncbi:MAG: hypothetical protein AB7V50_06030 [Vampirovibrionia bacterium]
MSNDKLIEKICDNFIGISGIIAIATVLFVCVFSGHIDRAYKKTPAYQEKKHSEALLESLQSGASIYFANQKSEPNKFSDYVTIDKKVTGKRILSLYQLKPYILKPDKQSELEGNTFEIVFKHGYKGIYKLDKRNVYFEEISKTN